MEIEVRFSLGKEYYSRVMPLSDKNCVPCQGGVPALTAGQVSEIKTEVPFWSVIENHHVERTFRFPDFVTALAFVNRIGALAEEQGHHPDIVLAWGKVAVTIWTHAVNGLTEGDFVLASKIDRLHEAPVPATA
jgi:4a-hydroxytetrahydrobiopterin dehydratase